MSKSTIWLDITEDDLKLGRRYTVDSCPIALALQRALGSQNRWSVFIDGVKWEAVSPGNIKIGGKCPTTVNQFVRWWDSGRRPLEPQRLRLWLGS